MDLTGNSTCAQQYYSATGDIDGQANSGAGCNQVGEVWPGSAPIAVRDIQPSNPIWILKAHYWLGTGPGLCGGGAGTPCTTGRMWLNSQWPNAATSAAQF